MSLSGISLRVIPVNLWLEAPALPQGLSSWTPPRKNSPENGPIVGAPGALRRNYRPPPVAAADSALDQALYSTLNAVPRVPLLPVPLLLGFGVDQRKSSFKFTTSALKAFVNSLHVLCCSS